MSSPVSLEALPNELKSTVGKTLEILGRIIRTDLGQSAFDQIESIRKRMSTLRNDSARESDPFLRQTLHETAFQKTALQKTMEELRILPQDKQRDVAKAFTLMLELINACENAYRTHRLRTRNVRPEWTKYSSVPETRVGPKILEKKEPSHSAERIIYVLTAHPTESRSPENIQIFHWIRAVLTDSFAHGFQRESDRLTHLIELAWRIPVVRESHPNVENEAAHIYSIVLRGDLLDTLIACQKSIPVFFRSWVGGDKDGHPGVDEQTLIHSLQLSRLGILNYVESKLDAMGEMLALLPDRSSESELKALYQDLLRSLSSLKGVQPGDGFRILSFRQRLHNFTEAYSRILHSLHPDLNQLSALLSLFPGLVIPLELRESADQIPPFDTEKTSTIFKMLQTVQEIAHPADSRWYAGELILSMTESSEQLINAMKWVQKAMKETRIPIVPLFEQEKDLENAQTILFEFLRNPLTQESLNRNWNRTLEVMVGYSDSAKEIGMLPSRIAIAKCLKALNDQFTSDTLRVNIFHGSGGSVDRGGGSIEDQISWWPENALKVYKSTIQGEMVDRLFSSPEILWGQIQKFSSIAEMILQGKSISAQEIPQTLIEFSQNVEAEYRRKTSSPELLRMIEYATPYRFLNVLKIGSRPVSRAAVSSNSLISLKSLRAIPWVLCWTQTRVLFPTWWGIGTAWRNLPQEQRVSLREAFRISPLFQSFVKLLGFTLAKVELGIWRLYLENAEDSVFSQQEIDRIFMEFQTEYQEAQRLVRFMTGSPNLLWYRPWLGTSIQLRSPMIHPLNLLQILAFENQDARLIQLTVTGIATGMMTTG